MKVGRDLQELAREVMRQAESKRDFLASTENVGLKPIERGMALVLPEKGEFPVGDIAHDQIAQHVDIPRKYYDRMRDEDPELLVENVDHWFKKQPAVRLNRTLDGRVRAFLSDKFMPFDNYDFAAAALPILSQRKLDVMSCEVTERRLYIKAVDQQLFRDVPVGHRMGDGTHRIFDTCAPAIILSNSEVGFGRLVIETGVYTSGCTNLALFAKGGMRRTHVGARHKLLDNVDVEDLDEILSDQAKQKMMEALWLQARDVIGSAFDTGTMTKRIEQMEVAAGRMIPEKAVEKVMEIVQKQHGLSDGERGSVFEHLIAGGNLSQYGLHAAVTRAAADVDNYDRATELEYLGGRVLELPANQWKELAEAA